MVIAVSTMRSVEERTSSRALIEVVRSARRRSLRATHGRHCGSLAGCPSSSSLPRRRRRPRGRARRWRRTPPGRPASTPLREVTVPLLPAGHAAAAGAAPQRHPHGARPARQAGSGCAAWPTCEPDLVIDTGDNLAHPRSVPVVLTRSAACSTVPGVSVFGSNDYLSPGWRNPLLYLLPDTGKQHPRAPAAVARAAARFNRAGWHLTNGSAPSRSAARRIALRRGRRPAPALRRPPGRGRPGRPHADVRLAITHAPYLRVLDQFAADGYDAIIAGHTHGGQVCLPGSAR